MTADGTVPAPHDLVFTIRAASHELMGARVLRDTDALLGQVVATAVAMVPAAFGGGISRTRERRVRSSHATSQDIYRLDQLQDRLGEGPCIRAADDPPSDGIVLARDLQGPDAASWPRFAAEAVTAGFRSILSVSLTGPARDGQQAALNLYSSDPDAFDLDARTVAGLFASQAAALLYGADQAAHLGEAVASRDVIGQAKGILMERFALDTDGAFRMLVKSSQDTNIKLVEVARWLVGETEQRSAALGDPDGSG